MAGHWFRVPGGRNQNRVKMEKVTLVIGFITCEVLMLGVGSALASGVGFLVFTASALYFGIKHTNK